MVSSKTNKDGTCNLPGACATSGPDANQTKNDSSEIATEQASRSNVLSLSLALGCATPHFILRRNFSTSDETQRRQRAESDPRSTEAASNRPLPVDQIPKRPSLKVKVDQPQDQADAHQPLMPHMHAGNGSSIQFCSRDELKGGVTSHSSECLQESATSKFIISPLTANTDTPHDELCGPPVRQTSTNSLSTKSATSFGVPFDTTNHLGRFFRGVRRYMHATKGIDGDQKVLHVSRKANEKDGNPMTHTRHEVLIDGEKYHLYATKLSPLDDTHVSMSMSTSTTSEESDATIPPTTSSLSMHSGNEPSYQVAARSHRHQVGLGRDGQSKSKNGGMFMEGNRKECICSIIKKLGVAILCATIGVVVVFVVEKSGHNPPAPQLDDILDPDLGIVGTTPTTLPTQALVGSIKFEERGVDPNGRNVDQDKMFIPSSAPSLPPSWPILSVDRLEDDGGGGRTNVVKTGPLPSNMQISSPLSHGPTQRSSVAANSIAPSMAPSIKALLDSPTKSPSSSSTLLYKSPAGHPWSSTSLPLSHEKGSQISGTDASCSRVSAEDQYKSNLTRGIDEATLAYLLSLDMFNLSWRIKVELRTNTQKRTTERFGRENKFSDMVQMAALRTLFFWTRRGGEDEVHGGTLDNDTSTPRTVKIVGTHSSDVNGLVELGLAFVSLHGKTAEEGIDEARRVIEVVERHIPGGFDNPIFTMHGFSYDEGVILGDGMLDYLQDIPVPAHVPFTIALHSRLASMIGAYLLHLDLDMPTILPSDEGRYEYVYQSLFADVLGAYYMVHPLGGLLTGNEICSSFLAYVRSTGVVECDREAAPSMQLTSSQKTCAAVWAIRWAWVDNATAKSGSGTGVASLSELKDRFDARYQRILNVDKLETCPDLSTFECMVY